MKILLKFHLTFWVLTANIYFYYSNLTITGKFSDKTTQPTKTSNPTENIPIGLD